MRIMMNCLQKVIIDSNSNLHENTAENQILAKIRRNQPVAELRSRLEIEVATGSAVSSNSKSRHQQIWL